jgi:hypothetical protein
LHDNVHFLLFKLDITQRSLVRLTERLVGNIQNVISWHKYEDIRQNMTVSWLADALSYEVWTISRHTSPQPTDLRGRLRRTSTRTGMYRSYECHTCKILQNLRVWKNMIFLKKDTDQWEWPHEGGGHHKVTGSVKIFFLR